MSRSEMTRREAERKLLEAPSAMYERIDASPEMSLREALTLGLSKRDPVAAALSSPDADLQLGEQSSDAHFIATIQAVLDTHVYASILAAIKSFCADDDVPALHRKIAHLPLEPVIEGFGDVAAKHYRDGRTSSAEMLEFTAKELEKNGLRYLG